MQGWQKSGLAALLLLLLAGVLLASEPEEDTALVLTESAAEPAKAEERPAHQPIAGSDRAASAELKDPFTLAHETREGAGKLPEKKKTGKESAGQERRQPLPRGAQPAPASQPPTPKEPKLTGIISGAAGQLALVDYGDKSLTLSAGEGSGGLQVLAIEAKRVLVKTPQGEKWLELP